MSSWLGWLIGESSEQAPQPSAGEISSAPSPAAPSPAAPSPAAPDPAAPAEDEDDDGPPQLAVRAPLKLVKVVVTQCRQDRDDSDADKEAADTGAGGGPAEPMIEREVLIRVFGRFNAAVTTASGKARLRQAFEAGRDVEDETARIQKEIFQEFGYDGEYGLRCLKRILTECKDDQPLTFQFMYLCQVESMACDEAELGPEGVKRKIEEAKAERAREVQRMRDEMQEHMRSVTPQKFVDDMKDKLRDMTPAQLEQLQQLAASRQAADMSDDQIMARAMSKIAAARQMMQKIGLSEQDVLRSAFESLKSGVLPTGVSLGHSHGITMQGPEATHAADAVIGSQPGLGGVPALD